MVVHTYANGKVEQQASIQVRMESIVVYGRASVWKSECMEEQERALNLSSSWVSPILVQSTWCCQCHHGCQSATAKTLTCVHESEVKRAVRVVLAGSRLEIHKRRSRVPGPRAPLQRQQSQVVVGLCHTSHGCGFKVLLGPGHVGHEHHTGQRSWSTRLVNVAGQQHHGQWHTSQQHLVNDLVNTCAHS